MSMTFGNQLRDPFAIGVVSHAHGGNGFAAATVGDLGFEPTLGATSADAKPTRTRRKTIEVGEGLSAAGVSAAGVSAAGASAGGVSAGATTKRTRRKKGEGVSGGALLTLKDLDKMHGQPPDTMRSKVTVKASGSTGRAVGSGVSGGGGRSNRNAIVREVMQKHGLTLPQASKYVKEHNLY